MIYLGKPAPYLLRLLGTVSARLFLLRGCRVVGVSAMFMLAAQIWSERLARAKPEREGA